MAIQINEVVVRAIITGDENSRQSTSGAGAQPENISAVSKDELLELIDELITAKKER